MLLRRKFTMLLAVLAATLVTIPPAPAAAATPPNVAAPNTAGLSDTDVSFTSDGETLHGTVIAPAGSGQRRPGLVLMGGSGWTSRSQLRDAADAFGAGGIVTLIYDKRTVGYSETQRNYDTVADDGLVAVGVLRARSDVDPAMVGLFGISEGGWVAPLAATRSPNIAYVITVGASGMNGAQQSAWYWGNLLRHEGITGSMLRAFPITGTRQIVGAGLFPEASYDPASVLFRLRQPMLALWGNEDIDHPPAESARIIQQALDRGGNTHYTIRFIPNGGPDLYRAGDGGFTVLPGLAPGYPELVTSWVAALAGGPPAASVQPAPHQDRLSTPLAPLAWYESTWTQVIVLVLLLIAFLGYPVTALVRRLRGRRGAPPLHRPARLLAAAGAVVAVGFICYFGFLQATGAKIPGPVLLGRPLPWLALQLLALLSIGSVVWIAVGWLRSKKGIGRRLGVLLAGGVLFVPWALYWGLLLP